MSTKREKILQKLNPKLLKMTPKLSGDAGSFIDLDSDSCLEDGAKNLMFRFFRNQDLCEQNKRNVTQNVTELTISSARYGENHEICELISERLILPFVKNDADDVSERPGKRLQKLKMELQEKMSAKWEEEYKRRVSENKLHSESNNCHRNKCIDEDSEEDDVESKSGVEDDEQQKYINEECEQNEDSEDSKEIEENENEQDDENNDEIELLNNEEDLSDLASVSSDHQINEECAGKEERRPNKDDELDDSYTCSLVPAYQPGGGMLYGGSELTQSDEGLPQNLLSPSLRLSINESSKLSSEFQSSYEGTPKKAVDCEHEETDTCTEKNKLFSQIPNDSFDLNEAFEFCSGKFPDREDSSSPQSIGDIPVEENSCEGVFQSSLEEESDSESLKKTLDFKQEKLKTRKNIIAFEDSDDEEKKEEKKEIKKNVQADEELHSAAPKLLSDDEDEAEKTKKKKKTRLNFSDEEDATNDCDEFEQQESEDEKEDESDVENEDEERSVHYDSEENEIINPREFFEKEAELSGEEWSGDEDERGLDEFDVEEGDADKLDDDQVRSQLEKIHIRRVLDDDAREVRLIQEILFEDGDLHSEGKQRDRKFKWKNLGAFEEVGNEGESKEEIGNSSEDDGAEEEEWRKIRHEKELFLMTQKKNGDLNSDEEIVEDFQSVKVTTIKTSIKVPRNVENIENTKVISDYTKITKTTNVSTCNSRGSFLTRNQQFLSRLAKATSGVTENVLGPKSSKNFVFATKSPEKKNLDKNPVCKRQMEDSESCRRDKKMRLLPPEIHARPSIVDLLV